MPIAEGEGGASREKSADIYALPLLKQIASGKPLRSTGSQVRCPVMTSRGGVGGGTLKGREALEGGDTCMYGDSYCCSAESNTTL